MLPVKSAKDARVIYDDWHQEIASREKEDVPNSPWHTMARRHLAGGIANMSVLEIGCGRGGFSKELVELGARLVAADFSPAAVDVTASLLRSAGFKAETEVADIQKLPHNAGSFDFVISLETLEHVPDPRRGLAELVRVARSGGTIIVSTPNYFGGMGIYRWYRERTGRRWDEGGQPICHPLRLIDRVRDLKEFGCRVVAVEGCGHYLYVPRRNPIRIRALDYFGPLSKWVAAHSLTVAVKL